MITFILIAVFVILAVAFILMAYSSNQRKRAGQSGEAQVNAQHTGEGRPSAGRPTGVN